MQDVNTCFSGSLPKQGRRGKGKPVSNNLYDIDLQNFKATHSKNKAKFKLWQQGQKVSFSPIIAKSVIRQQKKNWEGLLWFVVEYSNYTASEVLALDTVRFFTVLKQAEEIAEIKKGKR